MTESGEYVVVDTADGPMPAFWCRTQDTARGAVVVFQEVFGITPHIESITRRLAAAGWDALAPALFHRGGSPVLDYGNPDPGVEQMNALTEAKLATDIDAALAWLAHTGSPGSRVASIGFCLGGSVSLYAATRHELGAAVTFYGVGLVKGQAGLPPLVELAPRLTSPWLGIYGAHDNRAPGEQVEQLRAAAATAPVPTEVVVYEGAGHAFHCDARPDRFAPDAAADAWRRTIEFFTNHLG